MPSTVFSGINLDTTCERLAITPKTLRRFLDRTSDTWSGCVEYSGGGRVVARVGGKRVDFNPLAFAYFVFHGLQDDHYVRRTCGNAACVNPLHAVDSVLGRRINAPCPRCGRSGPGVRFELPSGRVAPSGRCVECHHEVERNKTTCASCGMALEPSRRGHGAPKLCGTCKDKSKRAQMDKAIEVRRRARAAGAPAPNIPQTKQCSVCGNTKSSFAFTRNHSKKDGLESMCKECSAARRSTRPRDNRSTRQWEAKHPWKKIAGRFVTALVDSGVLVRPEVCESCGRPGRIMGHHESYHPSMWGHVTWLCPDCHAALHAMPEYRGFADEMPGFDWGAFGVRGGV